MAMPCAKLSIMHRALAILAAVSILALPLAPLAWGMACESSSLPMLCCLMHSTHSLNGKPVQCHCSGKSQNRAPDLGTIAPIPPGFAAGAIGLASQNHAAENFFAYSRSAANGFLPAPFEPPRA
jgi:hypothetical protein